MFIILIVVTISQVYVYLQTHQIFMSHPVFSKPIKYLCLTQNYQVYLSKAGAFKV